MRSISHLSLLLSIFLVVSCASTTSKKEYTTYNQQIEKIIKESKKSKFISKFENIPTFKSTENKMAPGFLFWLNHPSDEKLQGRYRAEFDGTLRLPYNVKVNVTGLTFTELKDQVLNAYSKFFQRGVSNVEFKLLSLDYYVEVRGFVKKSDKFLVKRNTGLDKLIDMAEGLDGDLKTTFYKATITQQNQSYALSLNQYFQTTSASNVINWTGGDTVFISEQDESEMGDSLPIVTVLGGVNTPGKTLYKDNAHVFYYLGKSGGVISTLAYHQTYIIRQTENGIKKIQFDLTDLDALPAVEPNDIIMLQGDSRTVADKVFERTSQIASILMAIVFALVAL
jgi:protein involved in polysaccharide export with SLBB domain